MSRKRDTPEEILQHLRTVELDTGKGQTVLDACRELGITEQRCGRSFSTACCSTRSRKRKS